MGKVQSGKTSSFISLIGASFDNGYRIVIVLAGTKKNLLNQNIRRIKKDLGLESRTDRKIASFHTLNGRDIRGQELLDILSKGSNVLIKLLKRFDHIGHITKELSAYGLGEYATLVIDDEGDQASLNALKKKKKESTTYKKILNLLEVLKLHSYVAFTATPQANLLISTLDELSPDFCELIEPGSGYTGGSTFHGVEKKKYIRDIPDNEGTFEELDTIPPSLMRSLYTFIVGAAIRSLRGDTSHHSMLIHTHMKKVHHNDLGELTNNVVDNWRAAVYQIKNHPKHEAYISEFKKGYDELALTVESMPIWEEVEQQITIELKDLKVWVVNSSKLGEIPDANNMNFKNNIFIGGNMLDRGVTLDGLAVTYITRWAKKNQADTVEQRARWFGYKQQYLDVCRIFMPKEVSGGFAKLLGHEDDVWKQIHRVIDEEIPLKEWKTRIFALDPAFNMTRTPVAPTIRLPLGDKEWLPQRYPQKNKSIADQNVAVVKDFFRNSQHTTIERFGPQEHLFWHKCAIDEVVSKLLRPLDSHSESDKFSEILQRLKEQSISTIDIVWIEPDKVRKRTIWPHGTTLQQGRSTKYIQGNTKYYPGDRYIGGNESVQLQVHIIEPNNADYPKQVVMLALGFTNAVLRDRLKELDLVFVQN